MWNVRHSAACNPTELQHIHDHEKNLEVWLTQLQISTTSSKTFYYSLYLNNKILAEAAVSKTIQIQSTTECDQDWFCGRSHVLTITVTISIGTQLGVFCQSSWQYVFVFGCWFSSNSSVPSVSSARLQWTLKIRKSLGLAKPLSGIPASAQRKFCLKKHFVSCIGVCLFQWRKHTWNCLNVKHSFH